VRRRRTRGAAVELIGGAHEIAEATDRGVERGDRRGVAWRSALGALRRRRGIRARRCRCAGRMGLFAEIAGRNRLHDGRIQGSRLRQRVGKTGRRKRGISLRRHAPLLVEARPLHPALEPAADRLPEIAALERTGEIAEHRVVVQSAEQPAARRSAGQVENSGHGLFLLCESC